ncbi:MAG: tetratricopeptide repeat protein [Acidobacteria bacterium]|nr:tetratricopeptide repeat protein [Acidobacteriota bacterium]MCA1610302.1 tetratricopeptide repeat protein [Acidobacteriota bacterium]
MAEGAPVSKPSGVLRPWQRLLYRLLLIPLGLIAANAIYLFAFTRDTSFFYAMLLLHLVLGVLVAIPFFVFAVTHARRMIRMWNKRAKYAGLSIFALATVCVASGVFMTFKGATLNNRAIWLAHVLSVPLALVAFILHRRAAVHKLQFKRLFAWGGAVAAFLAAMAVVAHLEKPPKRIVNRNGDTVFFPASSETFDQGLLDGKKLAANDYCKSCHPDSFHQWERSAHRFSSFNNPFYRKSVELMADRVGRERTKWCSGCHDPVVLFTGQMGAATQAKFSYDSWEAQQGLTCMSCHSITEVKDVKGNGSYVIEESKQYPFAFSKNKTLQAVNQLLIRMEPSLHRKTFLKPVMRTPEFCSSCHKVALIPALNSYRWMRGQNHYDSWYDSGVSGRAVRSFYDPPAARACRDCHLPPYRSDEFGNKNGQLHDHLFPAANTALPFIRGDRQTEQKIREFLQNKVLTVDLFAIRRGEERLVLGADPIRVRPGETLEIEAVVRTRGVGHPYTNGTADSNETWVSLEGRSGGTAFFRSGVLDASGRVDPAADRLSQVVIDHGGGHMDRRQPEDIHVTLYNNGIGPGAARVVHYRMRVPEDARRFVELSAGAHYRKFSRDYTTFSLGAAHPSLPVTTLASDTVRIPVAAGEVPAGGTPRGNPDKLWQRWNDYGIGLFLQGDYRGAARAWTRVAELAPDKPDGPLNRARAEIAEGRLADARASLGLSEKIRPGWPKTAFFRATLEKDEGRLPEAERDLRTVLAKFPLDRVAWNNLGSVLWLAGRYPDAAEAYGKTLAIDSEDVNAHYNLMRIYRAQGDRGRAAFHEREYRKFKEDETGRAVAADFRRANPWANRESLPIHVHEESEPPEAAVPAWVAEMGRKGYQTDGGYLTRAHPPILRDAPDRTARGGAPALPARRSAP